MHEIYSDETGHERFRGIGAISGPTEELAILRQELNAILIEHKVKAIEWKHLSGDSRHERAAKEVVIKALDFAGKNRIRIDVLVWDTQDDRHGYVGVDHARNLEFMYYKVLRLLKQRWPYVQDEWAFYPDEKSGVDWKGIIEIIENTNLNKKRQPHPDLFALLPELRFPRVNRHEEAQSHAEPLVQAIDLLAGASRFSHEKGELVHSTLFHDETQLDLFGASPQARLESNGDVSKGRVLHTIYKACSTYKLHVSLKERKKLWSRDQSRSVNFWTYESAGDFDRAPARNPIRQESA
ncbi:MAG: hypothetical protein JNM27_11290 [Leptospirales bacterium]|nr:hypothetical protein [Leptospirales bacterium]